MREHFGRPRLAGPGRGSGRSANPEHMRRRIRGVNRQNGGQRRVGRQRCRFDRHPIGQDALPGKRRNIHSVSLIASEHKDAIAVLVVKEGHVPRACARIATHKDHNAAALRRIQMLAKVLITAGEEASGAAIA